MMLSRRAMLRAAPLGLAGLALGGCDGQAGSARPDPATRETPALAELHRQARARGETRVVVYSSTVDTEFEPLWLDFQADFPGIRVVYMMVAASQIIARLTAERVTGAMIGDLLMQPVDVLPALKARDDLAPYRPATSQGLDDGLRDAGDHAHYALYKLYGLAFNRQNLARGDLPRHLDDLAAPRWAGRFAFVKPLGPVTNTDVAFATLHRDGMLDRRQLESLYRQGSFAFPEAGVSLVAQGRLDLNPWAYLPPLARQRALCAPIDVDFVPDFSTRVPYALAVTRDAPNPHAARLLSAWLFSPRGQRALARRSFMQGTMPGAPVPALLGTAFSRENGFHLPSPPDRLLAQMLSMKPLLSEVFLKAKPR